MNREQGSILLSGVPINRITPETRHIERYDDWAETVFDGKTDKVTSLITPQDPFRRVHELMHARHSSAKRINRVYAGIINTVSQITEDCKIHLNHWPWPHNTTPRLILESANSLIEGERKSFEQSLANNPNVKGSWQEFAMRLRQAAVFGGIASCYRDGIYAVEFDTPEERDFAKQIFDLIVQAREGEAAHLLQSAFFDPPESEDKSEGDDPIKDKNKRPPGTVSQPPMEIIKLPLTDYIPEAVIGYRRATSGSRLHRPSLRKPILPQRLFVRKTATEAGGTILIDASASMGRFNLITDWCAKAPFGTVAYYAGNGYSKGWLWIYARNGKRASKIEEPPCRDNTVDGPAITWLMSQAKPRIMVTDRGFCDVQDSEAQKLRLAMFEKRGEITVLNYKDKD